MNRYSCSIIVLVILYHCPGLFSQARQKEDQSCTPTKVSSEGRTRIPGTHTGPPCELFFDTPENRRNCAAAIQQLRAGADNPEASPDAKVADLKALASLYRGTKDHKNAIATYQEAIRITSARPELYVSLAGVVWQDSYDKIAKLKVDLRLRLGEPYPPDPRSDEACRSLSATTLPNINELGIGSLEKALLLEPDNSDAMFYMGQFYVLKADLQCGDSGAGKEALQIAENWRHKAEEIRARISGSAAQFTPPRQEANKESRFARMLYGRTRLRHQPGSFPPVHQA